MYAEVLYCLYKSLVYVQKSITFALKTIDFLYVNNRLMI